jgi:hypothetical protein
MDKRRAAMALLSDPEWKGLSNYAIALHCGSSEKTVRNIRKEMDESGGLSAPEPSKSNGSGLSDARLGLTPKLKAELKTYAPDLLEAVLNGTKTSMQASLTVAQRRIKAEAAAAIEAPENSVLSDSTGPSAEIPQLRHSDSNGQNTETVVTVGQLRTAEQDEEELTDAQWVTTVPAYMELYDTPRGADVIYSDAVLYRKLERAKALEGFKSFVERIVDTEIRSSPLISKLKLITELPHPREWVVCAECFGKDVITCPVCENSGYLTYGEKDE